MRTLQPAVRALAAQQRGLLTMPQLADAGFRRRDVHLRIARGEWRRVTDAVIVLQALAPDRATTLWAASLHFHRAALAGSSALEILGLPAPVDGRIHILSPRQGLQPPFPGCVVHYRRDFVPAARQPDRAAVPDAVAQSLRWALTDRQGVFHAVWALQRSLLTLEELQSAVMAQSPSPGTTAMKRRLALLVPGAHSLAEVDFARECVRRGLPTPVRQQQRRDARGRLRYTDCEFKVQGRTVVVEIDGLGHLETSVHLDDQWRANELMLQGAPVFRVPALALRLDPNAVFEQLGRALRPPRAA